MILGNSGEEPLSFSNSSKLNGIPLDRTKGEVQWYRLWPPRQGKDVKVQGQRVTWSGRVGDSRVFVIGKKNTQPPAAPDAIHLNKETNKAPATLCWNEPRDDTGIAQYAIYRNGKEAARVQDRCYQGDLLTHPGSVWTVRALDPAGNLGESSPQAR